MNQKFGYKMKCISGQRNCAIKNGYSSLNASIYFEIASLWNSKSSTNTNNNNYKSNINSKCNCDIEYNEDDCSSLSHLPLLIDWRANNNDMYYHPSETATKGCKLVNLKLQHTNIIDIKSIFDNLQIDKNIVTFESCQNQTENRLTCTLHTPNGIVTL